MKKVITDTRQKKSIESFFENENSAENQNSGLAIGSEMSKTEEEVTNFADKFSLLLSLIKQVFLFLPGTFLLYLIGFVGTIILTDSFSVQEPTEIFGIHSVPIQMLVFGIIALFGIFMTWFGLGDIKNKKHAAIPISILATGGILAAISKILGDLFGFTQLFELMNYYFIYFFPLVLIVPILVKGWVDTKSEEI